MKKLKKNQMSGITLIALVVTIIVLLLLAGISVQMLTGEYGILQRAGQAREITEEVQLEEEARLAYLEYKMQMNNKNLGEYLNKLNGTTVEEVTKGVYYLKRDNNEVTINDEGHLTKGKIEVWDGTASTKLVGSGTVEDPFLIKDGKDLAFLSNSINNESHYTDSEGIEKGYKFACYKQIKDIYLNDITDYENWDNEEFDNTSLNEYILNTKQFCGGYDGNNYLIAGLYINKPDNSNVALFKEIYTTTDTNLKMVDCYVKNVTIKNALLIGNRDVGMISGSNAFGGESEISNCNVSGKIINKSSFGYVGGIMGHTSSSKCKIIDCNSSVNIDSNSSFIGGIVGMVTGNGASIKNCVNSGNMIGRQTIGGIVGEIGGIGGGNATIENCRNNGNIYDSKDSSYASYFGGIVGRTSLTTKIENCYNGGNIIINGKENSSKSIWQLGGIVGYSSGTSIINSNNKGNIIVNTSFESSSRGIGGIIGQRRYK